MAKSEIKHLVQLFPGMSGKVSHSVRMALASAMQPEMAMVFSIGDIEEAESLCKEFIQAIKEWKELIINNAK